MITKDIYIEDLVTQYPQAVTFLMQQGIVCVQCGEPVWGSLAEAAERKGITNIKEIVKELNRFLKAED